MCLYPRQMKNKRYEPTKKNGGVVPECPDNRLRVVPIPCGNCMECRAKKKREWQVRLTEDVKHHKNGKFVTLTFNDEALKKYEARVSRRIQGYERENTAVGLAVRHFLERWRRTYKKSIRHSLITELGHKGTKRIHIHGFLWTDEPNEVIAERWGNGDITIGERKYYVTGKHEDRNVDVKVGYGKDSYVGDKAIGYITKYINKVDQEHKYYKSKMYISNGIGKGYAESVQAHNNRYRGKNTIETYTINNGKKIGLPTYYRNKIYTDAQKEQLWLNKIEDQIAYVGGMKINIDKSMEQYYTMRNQQRKINRVLGYGSNWKDDVIEYLENSERNRLAWCRANGKHPRKRVDPQMELYKEKQQSMLQLKHIEYDTKKIPWDSNESTEKKWRKDEPHTKHIEEKHFGNWLIHREVVKDGKYPEWNPEWNL